MSDRQNTNEIFDSITVNGEKLTKEQRRAIKDRLEKVINYQPKIGVFGKTGVGKSSICNALFGKEICEISDVAACTRNPQEVLLNMGTQKGVKLVDVPGVGESSERDIEYSELYSKLLPELDLVLWVLKADDRAYASDENFYKNIVKPHIEQGKPFFFVLNQVDKIEPTREWDWNKHEPGLTQFKNIHRKVEVVSNQFNIASSKVIHVSANEKYNLTKLVDEFIRALPAEKKITTFKAVSEDFKSEATAKHVEKSFIEIVGEIITSTVEVAGEVVIAVVETAGRVIEKGISYVAKKIENWFSSWL